jgi:hypothetical protein
LSTPAIPAPNKGVRGQAPAGIYAPTVIPAQAGNHSFEYWIPCQARNDNKGFIFVIIKQLKVICQEIFSIFIIKMFEI